MTEPVIPTPLPSAPPTPQRNDSATFDDRVDDGYKYIFEDFPPALETLSDQTYQNALVASEAASQAVPAAATAVAARDSALEYRDSSAAIAAAVGEVAQLPQPLIVGRVLGAISTNTVGWVESAMPGDILTTTRKMLSPRYLPCTGERYLKSAYPKINLPWLPVEVTRFSTGTSNTASMEFATDNNGVWVAIAKQVTSGANIFRSIDDGATWTASLQSGWNFSSVATDKNGVWLISGINGTTKAFFRSTDNGVTWEQITGTPYDIAKLETDGNGVWIAGSRAVYVGGTPQYYSYLLRSTNNGTSWVTVKTTGGDPSVWISDIRRDGVGGFIASQTSADVLFKSTDGGQTWSNINTGAIYSGELTTDYKGVWMVISQTAGTVRSLDNGLTWQTNPYWQVLSTVIPGYDSGPIRTDGNGLWVKLVDSNFSGANDETSELLYSTDNGETWLSGGYIWALVRGFACSGNTWIIAGSPNNILRSVNDGVSFYTPKLNHRSGVLNYIFTGE